MEINYFKILKRYKKIFLFLVCLSIIISSIIVLKESVFYEATAKFYVRDGTNLRMAYAAIRSNRVYAAVINRLKLIEVFKVKNSDEARRILSNNLRTILDSRSNTVDVKFKSRDSILAAETANALVEEVEKIYPEVKLPETAQDPLDFRIIDKATPPLEPINQNKIGVVLLSIFLSVFFMIPLFILLDYFSSRGSREGQ